MTLSAQSNTLDRSASSARSYIYIANGHGAWEAALTNVLSKGDRILVLESARPIAATMLEVR